MVAGWIAAVVAVLGVLGLLIRLSYQVGLLVQRFGDHVEQADRQFKDQEMRLRALERTPHARPSGGHV